MKPSVRILLVVLVTAAAACERIPPSVSIPGYGEKQESAEKAASGPMGASERPPTFFPENSSH